MQHHKIIEQLGYSSKEANVYLAALSLGEAHISDIATKVKMPRSTVQVIVDRLHQDGLMNFYVMRRYKYWVAERPEKLLENLQKREAVITEALPELIALRKQSRQNTLKDEQLFQESMSLLRSFADTLYLPILITNSDAEIVYVNKAWQIELGYTFAEIKGENPRIFKSGLTSLREYEQLWKNVTHDHLYESTKIIDYRKDGTLLKMDTVMFAVHHGNRTFYIQILCSISD